MPIDAGAGFEVIAQTAAFHIDPSIAISAIQAGHCGIFDLEFADLRDEQVAMVLQRFAASCAGPIGLKLRGDGNWSIDQLPIALLGRLSTLILTPGDRPTLHHNVKLFRAKAQADLRILLEVVSPEEAELTKGAQFDGLIAKGNEAGGRVGESTSFILLQRLRGVTELPIWAQGGIGLHTIAAAYAAGAVGVVLDQQLLLTRESRLPDALKKAIARMDGSETQCLGDDLGTGYRIFAGPASAAFTGINQIVRRLMSEVEPAAANQQWRESLRRAVTPLDPAGSVWLFGQDAAFAGDLARDFKTVPGIINALRHSLETHIADARETMPLAAGTSLAQSHRTEFPIAQGPMTRVSDRAEFALKVAEGGALPFLALALMRGRDIETLLEKTRAAMDGRPWGVGILGFIPAELQAEQLAVVHACRPDFALLAGGRPEQAVSLEKAGIPTYLHVPSPGLLRLFLEAGARRFVFEGRECGGHVGPRTSFTLWNQMIGILLASVDRATAGDIHILFAGGIHDALSSAMVAAAAAPLARLGCKIGVLVGTAYTMTHEAVEGGAVVETFQQEVINCARTVLLESGAGHATRCVDTSFVAAFAAEKRRLIGIGETHDRMRDTLEALNVGRLRIAAKGVDRNPAHGEKDARQFVDLDIETQRADGLYMIGQVALLRDRVTSIRELHQDISASGTALLTALPLSEAPRRIAVLPPKPAEVAIIGMGCILPKAPDVESFWENILDQVDAIQEVPSDRWDWRLYFDPDKTAKDKIYSKWGGFIDDVAIDPLRYGIPPASLKSIEPLQLLTLETVRAALTDAGFPDGRIADPELRARTSVILGVGGGAGALGQRYAVRTSLPSLIDGTPAEVYDNLPEWTEDSFPGILMNVVAGRVANRFDLGGVNFTVDAACGSSLAAVRLAVQELTTGTSDMVIVGGCDAFQNPFDFVAFSKTQALSPRGKCRTFDATADGIAIGEGVALVVLRRAGDAMRDGSRIYARIQGVGGSSDGRDKSLTAPRPEGQALALRRAYGMADFSPATVGLIEAHGTGTVAGDRAEVTTLNSVFAAAGADIQACAIGSVKSMIGHTKCASGTAGLIKAALALYHKVLPPTNNVETPNPEANFAESPFFVAGEARPWITSPDGHARRAGVSAFGFGGTNFHVALEEHDDGAIDPDRKVLRQRWPSELFLIGAASRDELRRLIERLATEAAAALPARRELRELAQERALGYRAGAKFRLGMVAASHEELAQRIEAYRKFDEADADPAAPAVRVLDPRGVYFSATEPAASPRIGFLFPGQGAQYPNMLRDLAMHFDEVGDAFATADAALLGKLPKRLSGLIFPPPAFSEEERSAQQAAVTRTNVAQPAIGAASVAMARLLEALGVRGEAAAGHSYGEYVALHYAGAFDQATLYALSEARGRTMVEVTGDDPGSMASVAADAATVQRHLGEASAVQVANRNAPDQTVIAGPRKAVEEASARLAAQGLSVKPVRVACGFHSRCVAPARDRFAEILRQAPIQAPRLPVYSNMTASIYPAEAADVVALLADHLVSQVNFQDEILAMYDAGIRIFVEVGPSAILTGLVGRILKGRPHLAVASDMSSRPGLLQLQHALAQLAVAGVPIALDRLFADRVADVAQTRARRAKEATAVTAWLVNGGSARPAREISKLTRPVALRPAVSAEPPASAAPAPVKTIIERPPAPIPAPAPVIADRAVGNTPGAAQVMLQYQKLMEGFLTSQQHVMMAYLKAGGTPRVPLATELAAPAPNLSVAKVAASNGAAYVNGHAAPKSNGHVPPAAPAETHATLDAQGVADTLIAMISERTGYPPEMLGLDLNIEADLGIDSIKRVEILGAFRQQHIGESTDHVRAAMELITRKKTLREVVEGCYALLAGSAAPAAPKSNGHAPPAALAPTLDAQGVADTLIAMISERTGYPPEMLGLDLNIEADLGIDSIKRVEILGAFRQQHIGESTDHVRAAMELITRKKTLREVVEGCYALLAGSAAPAAPKSNGHAPPAALAPTLDAQGVADTLIAMISERTGYPPEMLGLDLNIEADLGIDSIKRVEILGAFRQQHIGESTDHVRAAMELITRKKTLREVVEGCYALLAGSAAPAAPKSNGHAPPAVVAPATLDAQGVADTLIAMISERTGYPPEMLGLDLNIEADLGIDSIKRVEILGAFRQQHIGESTDHVRAAMELITRKKTLREVVEGCYALLAAPARHQGNGTLAAIAEVRPGKPDSVAPQFDEKKAPRFVIVPTPSEVSSRPLRPTKGDVFLITDDEGGIAAALAARLRTANAKPILLRMGAGIRAIGQDLYSLDLSDMSVVKDFARQLAAAGDRIAGIFHCLPLRDGAAFEAVDLAAWRSEIGANVKSLFNLAAAFGEALDSHKAACAVAATRLGGSFGFDLADQPWLRPALAGIPGLLKTLAQESTNTRCKSVDFAADASAEDIAKNLLIEAGRPREEVEIGYRSGSRHVFRAERRLLSTRMRPVLDIGERAVILVTGGARGITAEVARAFAERHRPVLVLCGSSALPPAAEDAATAALTDARPLKAVLIKRARDSGIAAEPATIENTYRRLLKEREIRANIEALRQSAAAVEYHQIDVRDEAAFGGFIDRIYATHGRIDGVIHGAGIVEDKLIRDKTGESFDRVVDTKTASSFILSRRLRPDTLKFFALFTSVAGTFGNRGQSDYGAANEILSKLAVRLDRVWPGRVVAMSWGPWDKAGMVTPEIKRQFETLGIEAVSIELGRWAFDTEIRFGSKGQADPIWGVGPWAKTAPVPVSTDGALRKDWRHHEASGGTAQVVG